MNSIYKLFFISALICAIPGRADARGKITWELIRQLKMADGGGPVVTLTDSQYDFEESGYKCSVGKILEMGKDKLSWSMRTLKCVKGDTEVSSDVACGGQHGAGNSSGFTLTVGKDQGRIQPVLSCSSK